MTGSFTQIIYANPLDGKPRDEVVPVLFTVDELEAAKKSAFAEGVDQGLLEARYSSEALLNELTQQLVLVMKEREHHRQEEIHATTALLCQAIELIFPSAKEVMAGVEIQKCLHSFFQHIKKEMSYTVCVHPSLSEMTQEFIAKHQGLNQALHVESREDIARGDCKILWAEGDIEKNAEVLKEEVLRHIRAHTLGEHNVDNKI